MTYIQNLSFSESPLYFAYRRQTIGNEQFHGTFHAHQGVEILFVHEGKGTLIVDQQSYEVTAGMLCVFQPYQLHHIQVSPDTPFIRSIVHFEPYLYESYFERWPKLLTFFKQMHTSKLPAPCIYNISEPEPLLSLFPSLEEKIPTLAKKDELEEFSLFLVAFFRALRQIWERSDVQFDSGHTRHKHQAERILGWLEGHYTEPLRLEHMASELHLSPYHLSHLFKECTGSSISDYVTARRMQQAVMLLTSTEQSIAQIAENIGITNSSYFCKMFKSRMGSTPHQFRLQWQKQR
ncbi:MULTISPECIES: AraC family transcriptional regulator [Paenibacillus]|uniref:AraC family transcriptional regulator n=1 Tax=Paenibacillus violae TaxID=3077234 RepID=A0ABU3RDU1_9BACL|nr:MULTISPECIES: AraC family transcriptional regulator [Paenibacillus]MDU0202415.1 AraC family transcriptional regulator [Paenibacillus sp. PFR10]MEC0266254.1 AraC family transcriptional regulator [Paenibacillus anseongense]